MASVADKPTPKTQQARPAEAAAGQPAPKLVAVNAKAAPAGMVTGAKPARVKADKAAPAPAAGGKAVAKTAGPGKASPSSPAASEPVPGHMLTDEDILAMPESDYMNEVQLQFFKAKLLAMRAEILNNARETGEHLKENEVFADPNDRATVEEENMLEQRVRDRERKLLKKIEQSLARIESGEYGYCLETGEPIGIPRLLDDRAEDRLIEPVGNFLLDLLGHLLAVGPIGRGFGQEVLEVGVDEQPESERQARGDQQNHDVRRQQRHAAAQQPALGRAITRQSQGGLRDVLG
jgi:DnaK suppressor protein